MFQKGNSLLHLYATFPFNTSDLRHMYSYMPIYSSLKKIPFLQYLLDLGLSLEAENDVSGF